MQFWAEYFLRFIMSFIEENFDLWDVKVILGEQLWDFNLFLTCRQGNFFLSFVLVSFDKIFQYLIKWKVTFRLCISIMRWANSFCNL